MMSPGTDAVLARNVRLTITGTESPDTAREAGRKLSRMEGPLPPKPPKRPPFCSPPRCTAVPFVWPARTSSKTRKPSAIRAFHPPFTSNGTLIHGPVQPGAKLGDSLRVALIRWRERQHHGERRPVDRHEIGLDPVEEPARVPDDGARAHAQAGRGRGVEPFG